MEGPRPAETAAKAATKAAQQGPGPVRRFFELIFMLFSAILVLFSWDAASKANEENATLRMELRRSRKPDDGGDRSGTRCTVCLDNPREVLLQNCGHVCVCSDCVSRIRFGGDNRCPICRKLIEGTQSAFIS